MLLVLLIVVALGQSDAVRRMYVEDVIAETRLRFADEFQRRMDDGDPPGLEELLHLPKEEDLKKQDESKTEDNVEKVKYEQEYEHIPVYGTVITAAEDKKTGKHTKDVTGIVYKGIEEDVKSKKPDITKEEALEKAKKHLKHKDVAEENVELKIYEIKDKAHLAYMVSFLTGGDKKLTMPMTVVDAKTGEVLDSWETLATSTKKLKGYGGNTHVGKIHFTGEAGKLKELELTVDPNDNKRCLMDNSKFRVQNLNQKHFRDFSALRKYLRSASRLPAVSVDCNVNPIPDKPLEGAYNVMNDVYYFVDHSFKMFQEYQTTVSPRKLDVWVNFTEATGGNAAAFSKYVIVNNGGRRFYPLSSYADVLAHELGHTVTASHSKLEYREESGGMNEAFSDMSGIAFKHYLYGNYNWIIGEKAFKSKRAPKGLRFMNNPTSDRSSIDNLSSFKKGMDPHYSSGVYNKAFHDLTNKNGWDIKKAFRVFVRANRMYWSAKSTMNEGACGVLSAARDLNLSEDDVKAAFAGVGVECKNQGVVEAQA